MLVLSRKLGEVIQIGDGISITVVKLAGNKVQLGVTAPEEVPIVRGELQAKEVCCGAIGEGSGGAGPSVHALKAAA